MVNFVQNTFSQLNFETNGVIQAQKIEKTSKKFEKCAKALNEKNQQIHKLKSTSSLSLLEVFKIENKKLLKKFDLLNKKVKKQAQGNKQTKLVLKGLFHKVQFESIPQVSIFGFEHFEKAQQMQKDYKKFYLKVPPTILAHQSSPINQHLHKVTLPQDNTLISMYGHSSNE